MIEREWALEFAKEWIDAWNCHDLGRILSHYTDDVEMSSPLVVERLGRPDGVVKGKDAVWEYWLPSMSLDPPLEFECWTYSLAWTSLRCIIEAQAVGWLARLCRSMRLAKPPVESSNGLLHKIKNG